MVYFIKNILTCPLFSNFCFSTSVSPQLSTKNKLGLENLDKLKFMIQLNHTIK